MIFRYNVASTDKLNIPVIDESDTTNEPTNDKDYTKEII
jgi:hypothetical protein